MPLVAASEPLLLCFFLFQLLSKINTHKSRYENLKEVKVGELLCLHSIRSLELVRKTDLSRRLSFYALSKIHLDRHGSLRKILLIISRDINLNPRLVRGIKNKNLLPVLLFYDSSFSGDGFYYNLNSLNANVTRNDWDVFQKRGMHFIDINICIIFPKIDEVRYIAI